MNGDELWEPREAVLAGVRAAGYEISDSQLGRLQRGGAIFPPDRRAQGRGSGRPSRYPPGTADRIIRLLELAPRERRLERRAWLAWWSDGGALVPAARRFLAVTAANLDEQAGLARRLARGQAEQDLDVETEADTLFAAAETDRVSGPLGQARRRVGKKEFPTIMQFLIEVAGGTFTEYGYDTEGEQSLGSLVEGALGFARARTDALLDSQPWLQGDTAVDFARLSRLFADICFADVSLCSDETLDAARQDVQALQRTLAAAAEAIEYVFGKGAFSWGTLNRQLRIERPDDQVFFVLAWLQLGSDPETRRGMQEFIAQESAAETLRQQMNSLRSLRDTVPGFADLLAPEKLAAALTQAGKADELHAALAAARIGHEDEIDQTLRS